jgi:membrane-associated phospholipid phosphatase
MFRNFLGNAQVPNGFSAFLLGAAIGLFIAFFINIFSKISAHAVGMGGLLGMVVITLLLFSHDTFLVHLGAIGIYEVSMYWVLMLTVLLAGLVGTCRLILQAHEPTDLYGGYLVGFVSQFIALRFMF